MAAVSTDQACYCRVLFEPSSGRPTVPRKETLRIAVGILRGTLVKTLKMSKLLPGFSTGSSAWSVPSLMRSDVPCFSCVGHMVDSK